MIANYVYCDVKIEMEFFDLFIFIDHIVHSYNAAPSINAIKLLSVALSKLLS